MAEMPPLEEFSHLTEAQSATRFAESQNHIVYRTLIADTQTAVGAMMKLADGQACYGAVQATRLKLIGRLKQT